MLALFRSLLFFSFTIQLLCHSQKSVNVLFCIILLTRTMDMQICRMHKTSKSKAGHGEMQLVGRDYVTQRLNGKRCHHKAIYVCLTCGSEKRMFLNLMKRAPVCQGPTDDETLRALQFALDPLQLEDRADWTQDGDPPAFAGESEADYNERTDRYGDRQ